MNTQNNDSEEDTKEMTLSGKITKKIIMISIYSLVISVILLMIALISVSAFHLDQGFLVFSSILFAVNLVFIPISMIISAWMAPGQVIDISTENRKSVITQLFCFMIFFILIGMILVSYFMGLL